MAISETVGSTIMMSSEVGSVAVAWVDGAIQCQILVRTSVRVCSKQRTGALCRLESYPAQSVRGISFSFFNTSLSFSSFMKIRPRILRSKSTHLQTAESFAEPLQMSIDN